jgi:L-iditol 2-dehydrogenase
MTHTSAQTDTMYAALYYSPGHAEYQETAIPSIGTGEVLVKIETALTCGTDLKCFRRGHPVLLKTTPSPFGHEFAGTVVEVGDGVTHLETGERVVAANSAPCYQCFYCHKGQHNLCKKLDLLNGAYAQYLKIPRQIASYNTYTIPEHLPFEVAAFTEPLAVSLRGVEMAGVSPGDRVCVMGLGAIGQLIVRLAKWKGAHVTALGRSPFKMEMAKTFGQADTVVSMLELTDTTPIRKTLTPEGRGFDVVIEAIGQPHTWGQAIALVRRGGRVNLFAGCESGTQVSLDTRRIHYDEITLLSSFHHTPFYFKKALDLLASYEVDPTPLITTLMPMARFAEALKQVESGEAIKVALKPSL